MHAALGVGGEGHPFQSAPDREVGRCLSTSAGAINDGTFQSAPDREVGRCFSYPYLSSAMGCFNPRPTVRSGDARAPGHIRMG